MAITGDRRIEVFLAPLAFRSVGGKRALAFCARDAEIVATNLMYEYNKLQPGPRARAATLQTKADFKAGADTIKRDVNGLRAKGRQGPIPLCVYPLEKGKQQGLRDDRTQRRANAIHERLHADARGAEAEAGLMYMGDCYANQLNDILSKSIGPLFADAKQVSERLGWPNNRNAKIEEILARVEEVRQSCNRSTEDCDDTNRVMASQMKIYNDGYSRGRKVPVCLMTQLTKEITDKFGGARSVIRQATRKCGNLPKPAPRPRRNKQAKP